jgi:hypothetical protein
VITSWLLPAALDGVAGAESAGISVTHLFPGAFRHAGQLSRPAVLGLCPNALPGQIG